jgi:adenosylcobinamide kinase / adenosylcobinamide-phosphate guanylyltransferase
MAYTLLVGGARSGKSTLAVRMAAAYEGPVVFVATAEARDDEMTARINEHRATRPSTWATAEAPTDLASTIAGASDDAFVVLDCLTLWVSNELGAGAPAREVLAHADDVAGLLAERSSPSVVVSNEVGLGIVPVNELARTYRDLLGRVNTAFAARAARTLFVVAGLGLPLEAVTTS